MYLIKKNERIEIFSIEKIEKIYNKKKCWTLKINNTIFTTNSMSVEFFCKKCNKLVLLNCKYIDSIIKEMCSSCLREETCLKIYNSKSPFHSNEIQNKIKKNNLIKYGTEIKNLFGSEEFKENLKIKYGNQYFHNIEKVKQTNIEKYGVDNPWKSKEIKEKIKQNYLNKTEEEKNFSLAKRKETNKNKSEYEKQKTSEKRSLTTNIIYGVNHVLQSDKIKEKIKLTNYKKYYKRLIESNRLRGLIEPLFKENDYQGIDKHYEWKCCKCGNIFKSSLSDGIIPRCLKCFPLLKGYSNMEKEVADWIKSLNIQVDENNRNIINPLELDIYIPSHNLAIEFDGLYWHSELQGKDKDYHLNKTNKCLEKGIHLLHIFEDEWIEKQDIVKSIIKNNLGLHDKVVYGRNCVVREVSSKEANEFYEQNHIQGSCASSINLGLYFQDELVSCLSFAKPRFNKKYDWEITRFANKLNYKIHGSFGRLWKRRPVGSIITYSDKRLFTGAVYKKYMTQLADSKPSYWYIKNCQRHNRVEFQKHKLQEKLELYDANLTEWENMQLNGYDRIYDCGNWIFELK